MAETQRSAEAVSRIKVLQTTIKSHESTIASVEHEMSNRVRYFEQQIKSEQDGIRSHESKIASVEHDKRDRIRYFEQQIKREQDEIKHCIQQIEILKRQI